MLIMTIHYQTLPLPNPTAPKIESRRKVSSATPSAENIEQDQKDAKNVSAELSPLTGLNSVLTKLSSTGGKEIRLIIR